MREKLSKTIGYIGGNRKDWRDRADFQGAPREKRTAFRASGGFFRHHDDHAMTGLLAYDFQTVAA